METAEYFQPDVAASAADTMRAAVMEGPESILTGSFWPVASSFTCVPPTSMTRTFWCFFVFCPAMPLLRYPLGPGCGDGEIGHLRKPNPDLTSVSKGTLWSKPSLPMLRERARAAHATY